ncbi:hypothetical protein E5Q_01476 [Mixia osmundae IAM 14324]|uniref:Uncharacterized protein n=1 Tax=Mixia osmundae (strain CBS 9802 / IAM 14324 / JCM 22182 / KY 12970) TaxID=764103 RepID=G7DW16_MIXOS|nr:hypothetical protein E5Q_01476 [Mixia osmundae IAM 14324]
MTSALAPSAATAVAEFLKSPDDLVKTAAFRVKLEKEKASIEAKLKSGAKEQLDATRDGLAKLRDSRTSVGQIREEMVSIERVSTDPTAVVQGFPLIQEISQVHRNLTRTIETVNKLRGMYDKIDQIEAMLARERSDPLGPSPNLLPIHHHLSELEAFRNETVLQASRSSPETTKTLNRYFERLGMVIEAFESHYLHLAGSLVELAKADNSGVAVKLVKIAQVEGLRDEKAIAVRLVKKNNAELAARFNSIQADSRVIKHYRAKVMTAIKDSAKGVVQRQQSKSVAATGDPLGFLDSLDFFMQDLLVVEDRLVEAFPPDWKIYTVFVKAYHTALYEFLKGFVKSDPDAGALLRVAQFAKTYEKTLTKELSIPPELLQPKLLDGSEQTLVDDYLKLIVKKMEEWAANLFKTESAEYIKREAPPEEAADGQYSMQGAVIMFQMINQQVDLAADSGQGSVLSRVVDESNRVLRENQAQWIRLVDSEYRKQIDKPDEAGDGLVEYTIALANDQIKSADFTEALLLRIEPLVSEKYKLNIVDKLNEAMDGYLDVSKRCVQLLIDIIFSDLRPAVKTLFGSSWYSDDPMTQIIETVKDYLQDYRQHLNPNLFDLFIEDVLDTFVITYLTSLKKASKLKMPKAADRVREDIRSAYNYFATIKSTKELAPYFDVLDAVLKLITASKMMFFLDYFPFAKQFGPQFAFVEAVLRAREDLDRKQVNEMMESIRKKAADEQIEDPLNSVFRRLPK